MIRSGFARKRLRIAVNASIVSPACEQLNHIGGKNLSMRAVLRSVMRALFGFFVWSSIGDRLPAENATPKSILTDVGITQYLGAPLPLAAKFSDEQGNEVLLKDYFHGRPVILAMVYYQCPMLCGELLQQLTRSLSALDLVAHQDYELVVISISPVETPDLASAKKKHFVARSSRPDAAHGWHFLTGKKTEIDRVAKAIGFQYRYDAASEQYVHASGLAIATPDGEISQYFLGLDFPTKRLRRALVHAADGQVGGVVDQILLLCFHYDPLTGQYGLAIANVLQWLGVTTVSGIVAYIGTQLWRERRRRRLP